MKNIKHLPMIIMLVMVVLSFTNLFGLNLSFATIIVGVVFFFLNAMLEKKPLSESGLDVARVGKDIKVKNIWIWMLLPIVMDAICVAIAYYFLPDYLTYETDRASGFVAVELSLSSVLLFFVFALGEEIAWRAFFQNHLSKVLPILPVLILSSILFSLGHYTDGDLWIVSFGLLFTLINSVLYGVIFHKTKNAWMSAIAHYIANMFEVILFILIL